MKKRTTILSLAFFAILMLVKISSFHAYTHDDCNENSIEDCSLCELAVENQQEFYFVTENYNLELFIPNTIAQQQQYGTEADLQRLLSQKEVVPIQFEKEKNATDATNSTSVDPFSAQGIAMTTKRTKSNEQQ